MSGVGTSIVIIALGFFLVFDMYVLYQEIIGEQPMAPLNKKIARSLLSEIMPVLRDIKYLMTQTLYQTTALKHVNMDILRQQILDMYLTHSEDQTLSTVERDQLNRLYGNYDIEDDEFIERIYKIMRGWEIKD